MLESTGSHGRCRTEGTRDETHGRVHLHFVWAERDQIGTQYSAAESQSAKADDRRVLAMAPQVEPASFINKLFWFFRFVSNDAP